MKPLHLPLLGFLGLIASCGNFEGSTLIECPSATQFAAVSPVLEKRCGSLDGHGSIGRPLIIQGQNGLRYMDNLTGAGGGDSGVAATTDAERDENRRSVCGLEPERTGEVVRGALEPRDLMILRKPLLIERHKGGQLLLKGGAGDACIESWLRGDVDTAECALAISLP